MLGEWALSMHELYTCGATCMQQQLMRRGMKPLCGKGPWPGWRGGRAQQRARLHIPIPQPLRTVSCAYCMISVHCSYSQCSSQGGIRPPVAVAAAGDGRDHRQYPSRPGQMLGFTTSLHHATRFKHNTAATTGLFGVPPGKAILSQAAWPEHRVLGDRERLKLAFETPSPSSCSDRLHPALPRPAAPTWGPLPLQHQ